MKPVNYSTRNLAILRFITLYAITILLTGFVVYSSRSVDFNRDVCQSHEAELANFNRFQKEYNVKMLTASDQLDSIKRIFSDFQRDHDIYLQTVSISLEEADLMENNINQEENSLLDYLAFLDAVFKGNEMQQITSHLALIYKHMLSTKETVRSLKKEIVKNPSEGQYKTELLAFNIELSKLKSENENLNSTIERLQFELYRNPENKDLNKIIDTSEIDKKYQDKIGKIKSDALTFINEFEQLIDRIGGITGNKAIKEDLLRTTKNYENQIRLLEKK